MNIRGPRLRFPFSLLRILERGRRKRLLRRRSQNHYLAVSAEVLQNRWMLSCLATGAETIQTDKADYAPEETVHVGDHVQNDVVGANRSGLKTVWIQGFYEREDPSDPLPEPDAAVSELGQVVAAIQTLAEDRGPA